MQCGVRTRSDLCSWKGAASFQATLGPGDGGVGKVCHRVTVAPPPNTQARAQQQDTLQDVLSLQNGCNAQRYVHGLAEVRRGAPVPLLPLRS